MLPEHIGNVKIMPDVMPGQNGPGVHAIQAINNLYAWNSGSQLPSGTTDSKMPPPEQNCPPLTAITTTGIPTEAGAE